MTVLVRDLALQIGEEFYFIFSLEGLNCLFANIEIGFLQNIDNIQEKLSETNLMISETY